MMLDDDIDCFKKLKQPYVAIDNDSDNLKVRSLLPSDKKNLNLRSFFMRHHGRK